ncbi:MAG: hypothetical protein V1244_06085 [Nitrospinaceae bacterium]|jgi:hypothetical protein|nr:hypothetical protein [Nitrospinaceae bacterium]|tara:strand:- start:237 stop:380 length:144 start_codon:yes stop_codon:yes gene_type:complete
MYEKYQGQKGTDRRNIFDISQTTLGDLHDLTMSPGFQLSSRTLDQKV